MSAVLTEPSAGAVIAPEQVRRAEGAVARPPRRGCGGHGRRSGRGHGHSLLLRTPSRSASGRRRWPTSLRWCRTSRRSTTRSRVIRGRRRADGVARECVEELGGGRRRDAEDPRRAKQHVSDGLSLVGSVHRPAGLRGHAQPEEQDQVTVRRLLTACGARPSTGVAKLSIAWRDPGGGVRHGRRQAGHPPTHTSTGSGICGAEPLHHPRRRGVRLPSIGRRSMVRSGPARPRRADHRRDRVSATGDVTLGRLGHSSGTSGSRSDVPRLASADRSHRRPSPTTPSGCSPGGGSVTVKTDNSADVRHLDVVEITRLAEGRLKTSATSSGPPSTR